MITLTYKKNKIPLQEGQSVLEALLEGGQSIPYACKQGVCQSCLLKADQGDVPVVSQVGLKPTQQAQNYFLSCLCKPDNDLDLVDCHDLGSKAVAQLVSVTELTPSVYALSLTIQGDFTYKAGQYINLIRPSDQLTRSYSIASTQAMTIETIDLHIKVFPGGEMSNWLCSPSSTGAELSLMGPMGNCFYLPEFKEKKMLLLGYSTGLAPLYGILREALSKGHTGDIHLYHWGTSPEDLYYQAEILALTKAHSNVFYKTGLEMAEPEGEGAPLTAQRSAEQCLSGEACAVVKNDLPELKDWKIFLCGSQDKVNKARRVFYLAGADLSDIYADAFFTWQTSEVAEKVS